uniref:Uncharacterized protein n=1 Tax=candidate division WOR-3 bacterium TaxID=2052148 RepID=A0A7C4YHR6_UNCW3
MSKVNLFFKSLGFGILDFILSIPLMVFVVILSLFFIVVFQIPDKLVYILAIAGIIVSIIKLLIDTIMRKDKKLYIFWFSFILLFIILLLFILLFGEIKFLPAFFFGLSYIFLMVRLVKINREKGVNNIKFWINWIILPLILITILCYTVPAIVIAKNNKIEKKIEENIGIKNLKDFYKPNEEENGNRFIQSLSQSGSNKINQFYSKYLKGAYTPIPETAFSKDLMDAVKFYIPYLESLSNCKFIQKGWLGDYEDNLYAYPIPNFMSLTIIEKAGIISALQDVRNRNYSIAKEKLNKIWHIAKICRDNNLISSMISLTIFEDIHDFIRIGIYEGWGLRREFEEISSGILKDIEKIPLVIPCSPELFDDKIVRVSGMSGETYFMLKILKEFSYKFWMTYFGSGDYEINWFRKSLITLINRLLLPYSIFVYDGKLKEVEIYFPQRFNSKDEFIRYYFDNDVKGKMEKRMDYYNKRVISSSLLNLAFITFDKIIMKEISNITFYRLINVAYEVEKNRLKDKKYPEKLEVSQVDPFSGNPLIYKKMDKGYIIYSIGENKIDENGKGDDIAFIKE